ncbi:hypothetical protein MHH49_31055 [Paenibacillus sp. FSL F4-0122]|uniref:hypothetical protein n=1 Tax=Paenibacillus sp. FSL F4-0122 TaxID=2921371 RepID=UPI0030F65663
MKNTGNLGLKKPEGTDLVDIDDLNYNADIIDTAINNKVDKVTGKQLSTNDYTAAEKTKLAGIATGATNYTHPATHPPSIIAQDASNRFVTDAEKVAWNGKAPNTLVSAAPQSDGLMRATDKIKLDGIATGANNYVHPANHPATIITEDATHRFATDIEKSNWNSKPNLATTPQQTTADITYYVRTDGNDGNTGLANTAGGAFKTISKAVSMIPKIVNHAVVINVGAGTYPEQVIIAGFSGSGYITVSGDAAASTSRSVNIFTVYRNPIQITVKGFNITSTTTTALYVEGCANVILQYLNIVGSATGQLGIQVHSSKVFINASVISNRTAAMQAVINGEIISDSNSGTGNYDAANAGSGGKVTLTGSKPAGINETSAGGTIFDGGGVINPWGDNTLTSRSAGRASMSASQTLGAGVATRLAFNTQHQDYSNEFNATLNRFTVKKSGWYLITGGIGIVSVPVGTTVNLMIYINGVRELDVGSFTPAGTVGGISVYGSGSVYVPAGSYVELYAFPTNSVSTHAGSYLTSFTITQLA